MVDMGLIDEVRGLRERGYGAGLPSMACPGYRQIGMHLEGRLSLEEAIQRTKIATHQLARRQNTWFSPKDARIRWFEGWEESLAAIEREIKQAQDGGTGT